jgi:hypothetical protein
MQHSAAPPLQPPAVTPTQFLGVAPEPIKTALVLLLEIDGHSDDVCAMSSLGLAAGSANTPQRKKAS